MEFFVRDGAYLLCPHCAYPLSVEVVAAREKALDAQSTVAIRCNTCSLDVRDSQAVPCSMREVENRTYLWCVFCGASRPAVATFCAVCKRWQNANSGRERQHDDRVLEDRICWRQS
jgi:hypothetical protein